VSADDRKDIMDKVEDLKKAKEGADSDLLQKNYGALSDAIQKVGAAMYQNQESNPPAGGQANQEDNNADAGAAQDEPVEAEFKETNK
jgi:molecular chaperone DnaK